jgi:alginate O-acetyltransferase complex protein AlgI
MVFTTPVFLFLFLPATLALVLAVPRRLRNLVLLVASLVFYAWGEVFYVLLMLASIALNYAFGLWIGRRTEAGAASTLPLSLAVAVNLGLLAVFKYANFAADGVNAVLPLLGLTPVGLDPVHLPIGISFYTFQALSYVIDVSRGQVKAQRNPLDLGLYIALFPQLIAGPIVRYSQIYAELASRVMSLDGFAAGVRRFVMGLGKKMLLANPMGLIADQVLALPAGSQPAGVAWLGIAAYALQIYYDFSGYSDMAIGLGRMLGFDFPENFRHPYAAQSLREFWRRWHITLSTWFRDYLYIPLGGNRVAPWRAGLNLWLVFLLCGLWHGASFNFVIWGAVHGTFLALERTAFGRLLDRCPRALRHAYTLLVVLAAWVFFRLERLPEAFAYLLAMAGLGPVQGPGITAYASPQELVLLALAALLSWPLGEILRDRLDRLGLTGRLSGLAAGAEALGLSLVLFTAVLRVAAGTYNPFIYFRF